MSEDIEKVETEGESAADMPPVPWLVHESDMARLERAKDKAIENEKLHSKRFFIGFVIAMAVLVASWTGFFIYEAQFETISYSQDGAGLNNINTGEQGDLFGSEAAYQAQAERQGEGS